MRHWVNVAVSDLYHFVPTYLIKLAGHAAPPDHMTAGQMPSENGGG